MAKSILLENAARIVLVGHVPSKKNAWRRRANGGIGVDRETQAEIDSLVTQARIQWGPQKPLESPEVAVSFQVRDRRGDRDNKLTCILDVLCKAGVLQDDNVKRFNGTLVLHPASVGKQEETVIDLKVNG